MAKLKLVPTASYATAGQAIGRALDLCQHYSDLWVITTPRRKVFRVAVEAPEGRYDIPEVYAIVDLHACGEWQIAMRPCVYLGPNVLPTEIFLWRHNTSPLSSSATPPKA